MRAGLLRHRIEIQSPTRVSDGQGGWTTTWATIAGGRVWAEISRIGTAETFELFQLFPQSSHQISIRHMAGITSRYRVLFGTRVFWIQGVENVGDRGIELRLAVEEQVDQS